MIFLGTGAAELYPNPLCGCKVCERARKEGALPRKRSAFLLDDSTVVDFGEDVLAAAQMYNIRLNKLKNIFITHTHEDHFSPANIGVLSMTSDTLRPKRLFMSTAAAAWLKNVIGETQQLIPAFKTLEKLIDSGTVELVPLVPYTQTEFDGMRVSLVQTNHYVQPGEQAVNYCFETMQSGKLLYVADSGLWNEENLEFFRNKRADRLIMEGTQGNIPQPETCGHLNAGQFLIQCDNFLKYGVITKETKIYVTHINQVNTFSHDEYQRFLNEKSSLDITVAYDGMRI